MITIYQAKKIITMNRGRPVATHVAVRDGRILGVGSRDELEGWGEHSLDDRFADKVLMPGLVEGHAHLREGNMWRYVYCGFHDRRAPDGKVWKGLASFDAVIARLKQAEVALDDADETLIGWGFDPIYFGAERMTVRELDRVSPTRPIMMMHASLHLMNVNTAMLKAAEITRDTPIDGICKLPDGEPSGELQEPAAMYPVYRTIGDIFYKMTSDPEAVRVYGRAACLAGVTTVTDLVSKLGDDSVETLAAVTAEPDFPARLVPALAQRFWSLEDGIAQIKKIAPKTSDKLKLGMVKLIVDGSIQGFTARMRWPGYYNGAANGMWVVAPSELFDLVEGYHAAGVHLHIHTNGDQASEVALEALQRALDKHPRLDHRHTLQHCQMASEAQFRRMAELGVCANLFANHIFYWGDAHHDVTMGPDRARRINACATAQRCGVPFTVHSDAPITPIGPLFTAWCAANRITASGRVLGPEERISVEDALQAVTMGAAFTLKLDHEIGSIEVGKWADFAVLEDDPLKVAPEALKDVRIAGTVLAGRYFPAD